MSEFRHIGKESVRPDAAAKATGKATYIHDLQRPGMLYGHIKFSQHPHARILNIDTRRAERLPGVRCVVTAQNTPEIRIGFLRDNYALKGGKVRQFRDEVAAVAAVDPDIAAEAASLIEVEYEPLPAVFDPVEAMRDDAPRIHERDARGRPVESNRLPVTFRHHTGDLQEARRGSAHVVEGRFTTPMIQQCCMGTAGCIAEMDLDGNLSMWAKTQIPFLAQRDFNRALKDLGLAGRNSRVIVPALGGGFGTGLDTHAYEYIAILLAWKSGRPVKILFDRDDEFAHLSPRQSSVVDIEQGCDSDGRLTFRDVRVLQDNGAYASWGATYPSVMLMPATSLYRVPVVHFDSELVYTNNTYCQAMRGYGNPELTWALESNLDELAEAAGIDPVDLRRINCNQPGETTPMGLKISTCGLAECIDATERRLGWSETRGAAARRGVGMASLLHVGGSGRIYRSDASGILLRMDDYANVYVHSGGVEMGQGLHSALTLCVAEAVGVSPKNVFINETDTATCPWDVGTHASRGAFVACNAAVLAARDLRAQIFAAAEELYPVEAERKLARIQLAKGEPSGPDFDLAAAARRDRFELIDGVLSLRDAPDEPWLRVDLARLLRSAHFREGGAMFSAQAFYDPPSELPDWNEGMGNMSATYAWGTQGAEVEVDTETGEVKILKLVAVHDVGRVLNPQTLAGQTYGALAQGLGYALYEQVLTDRGRVINPNFTDYKIPTACEMDMPIELEFIETDDAFGPFGAKGVGEPGLVPTAPAIANAIYDAVGVRIRDLPITPERVLAALDEKERRHSGGR
jgi:xanthine dehydrogenase molybdenum-binding subunit